MRSDEVLKKAEEGFKESNKVLIRELIRDLEEKGISPVISVDGEVKDLKLKVLQTIEVKWLKDILQKFNLKESDFCLLEEDTTKSLPNTIYAVTGNVFLVHKKSAKIKKYKAGNNSHWVADFRHDLENKFFQN